MSISYSVYKAGKRQVLFNCLLGIILIFATSCVYYPQAVDIPLIREKNDLRLDAGISTDISAHGTVSYGLTDKTALQGFARFGADNNYYFQGAGGMYNKYLNGYVSELYGGFGYGNSHLQNHDDRGHLEGNYQVYFVQVNYGRTDRRFANLDYALGLKTGLLSTNLTDRGWWEFDYFQTNQAVQFNDKSLFVEPQAVLRIGGKKLKFNLKLGSGFIWKLTNSDNRLPYGNWNIGIGLNYHF